MNKQFKLILILQIAILLVAVGGYFFPSVAKYLGAEGDTNYTNLVTSGYITAGGALSVTGNTTFTGTLDVTGEANLRNLVYGDANGALPAITTSTVGSITAAVLCDNSVIDISLPAATAGTITFPSSTAVTGDCLTTVGDTRDFVIQNATTTGYFTLAISDGSSSLKYGVDGATSATSTLNAGDIATVKMVRGTSSSQPWLFYLVNVMR